MGGQARTDREGLLSPESMGELREVAAQTAQTARRSWLLSLAKRTPEELERMAAELEQQAKDVRAAAARVRRRAKRAATA
jgi:hypothetical protein